MLDHIFYPVGWLRAVGYFDRGALAEANYPPVPKPNHWKEMKAQGKEPQDTTRLVDRHGIMELETSTGDYFDSDDSLNQPSTPSTPREKKEKDQPDSTADTDRSWFSLHKRELLVSLFSLTFVLLGLVFFSLGRMYESRFGSGSRRGYAEIATNEEEPYPTGGGGRDRYRQQYDTVQPNPRVVLTQT